MRRVSIADIARQANVSVSTVSRALKGNQRISPDVRQRVVRLAAELGYTPNAIAQSLQQRHSDTIGLVVPDVADPFWGEVVKGIEHVLGDTNKALFLSASHHDATRQLKVIELFHRRRVDGIIIADAQLRIDQLARLTQLGAPVVFLNQQRDLQSEQVRSISIDNRLGGRLAALHLWQLGHDHFAYLGSTKRPGSNQQRADGFVSELTANGVPERQIVVRHSNDLHDDLDLGYMLTKQLFEWHRPTAIFCYNDIMALGALAYINTLGLQVPADVSVIGFDDVQMARYSTPALTTIGQPKAELGRVAARTLLDLIAGQPATDCLLEPFVVSRASTSRYTKGDRQ